MKPDSALTLVIERHRDFTPTMRSFVYLCNTLWQGQIAMNLLFATVVGFALGLKPCEGASHFH
jgi:hypothetical protein